jgi:ABC-type cobalamin transport system permease subunit
VLVDDVLLVLLVLLVLVAPDELSPEAAWSAETRLLKSDLRVVRVLSVEEVEELDELSEPDPN